MNVAEEENVPWCILTCMPFSICTLIIPSACRIDGTTEMYNNATHIPYTYRYVILPKGTKFIYHTLIMY